MEAIRGYANGTPAPRRAAKAQFRLKRDRIKFGSLGAASEVRKMARRYGGADRTAQTKAPSPFRRDRAILLAEGENPIARRLMLDLGV